jgi:hypothetical protein
LFIAVLTTAAINIFPNLKLFKMKNELMRFVTVSLRSKFFRAAMVVALVAGTGNFASAQAVAASNLIASNDPVTNVAVNHVSTTADKLVFNVKIVNAEGKKFSIIVKDTDGNTLFHNSYSDKKFNKLFQLPKSDDGKYKFIIKDDSGAQPQTFEVNSNVRFIEEVSVRKVM